jgi:hypothetical protein
MDLMGIRLRKRSRPGPVPALDDTTMAERAAMATLADTLRRLAAELPAESRLAAEFSIVAHSIDVTGVVGTWRLESTAEEFAPS